MRLFCLWLPFLSSQLDSAPFRVAVEYPKATRCEVFALKSKALIEEWYPRINDILFGASHPLATGSVTLICEPLKPIAYSDIKMNRIHISTDYVAAHPEDYGMVVHELTHIVQHYTKLKREEVWLQEGIADYVRHKYFERDIQSLSLTIDPIRDSYRSGYRVTAAFLAWLEENKNPAVVQELNRGCSENRCNLGLFRAACGTDVDILWSEFLNSLQRSRPVR